MNEELKETILTISPRNYNGAYGKGSIFKNDYTFTISQNEMVAEPAVGITRIDIEFCIDDTTLSANEFATVTSNIPVIFDTEKKERFNSALDKIKSNRNYKYDESHYDTGRFDPRRLKYTDLYIDGKTFEIENEDPILRELRTLVKFDNQYKILQRTYKEFLK